jgi:hypothetical protein
LNLFSDIMQLIACRLRGGVDEGHLHCSVADRFG